MRLHFSEISGWVQDNEKLVNAATNVVKLGLMMNHITGPPIIAILGSLEFGKQLGVVTRAVRDGRRKDTPNVRIDTTQEIDQ